MLRNIEFGTMGGSLGGGEEGKGGGRCRAFLDTLNLFVLYDVAVFYFFFG